MSRFYRLGARAASAALIGLVALSATTSAFALQPSPTEQVDVGASSTASAGARDEARSEFAAGQVSYGAGDFAAAEAHFAKADSLVPSVQARYWRGMSLDQQGKTAAALDLFKAVLDTPGHENLGADKVAQVRQRVAELSQAPADLTLNSTPPGASVDVNGTKQPGATPLSLRLAAGRHRLTLEAPGYAPQVVELAVNPGDNVERTVVLVPSTAAPPAPVVGAEQAAATGPRSRAPAFVTLGIAGASAVVGTIFGIKALDEKSQYDDAPTTSRADSVERNALIADMAFGVALTLGITGVVLLVADDAPGDQALEHEKRPSVGQLRVAPYVTPQGAGAGARVTF
jgi:tetratricopeptide (TPR) repeat protein